MVSMSEGSINWKGESAEKDVQIDVESGYFKAQAFSFDPVEYLRDLHLELLDDEYSEVETSLVAIESIREILHIVQNENVPSFNEKVTLLKKVEDLSPDWARIVFGLLKEADYSKESIKTWLLLDEPFNALDEEMSRERMLNQYLDEVYGE